MVQRLNPPVMSPVEAAARPGLPPRLGAGDRSVVRREVPDATTDSRIGLLPEIVASPAVAPERKAYRGGETIVAEHEPADRLFYVHRGQVRLYHSAPGAAESSNPQQCRLIGVLGVNEWFGTAALSGADRFGVRAVAQGPTVVSTIRPNRLLRVLADNPRELLAFTRDLARRLEQSIQEASGLIFDDCNTRLLRKLLQLTRTVAATATEDGRVQVRITHQQIAQSIGVARETVSLALGELRKEGLLQTGRNQVVFRPADLQQRLG